MKKLILAAAVVAAFTGTHAYAEDAAPAAKPDNETSFNAAVVSDYRYRGISQTRLKPALQGGFDYTNNPTGFYAGTWLSTIKWTKDAGGSGDIEWDIYAGKRGQISADVSYDVGVLTYVYPSNDLSRQRLRQRQHHRGVWPAGLWPGLYQVFALGDESVWFCR